MARLRRALTLGFLAAASAVLFGAGQEPILSFSLDPDPVTIRQGGGATALMLVRNRSVHQADDIEPIVEIEGISLRAEPPEIEALAPFGEATIALHLSADEGAPLGDSTLTIEVLYSYCIGEVCFQLLEEIPLVVAIEPPSEVVVEVPPVLPDEGASPTSFRWGWLGLGIGILLVVAALVARRALSVSWPLCAVLISIAAAGIAYGVVLGQHDQARQIGAVLCTSCVGIERTQRGEPKLTAEGIAAVERIDRDVELVVFFATWCHACPYAEAMVEDVTAHNPRIIFRAVDVDREPELAEASGVVRSGRTVVPAILRVDTGEILFGAEGLERRLLELLGGGP